MTPVQPYLLRAYYEWLLDNDMTPQLLVAATAPGVKVPTQFVQEGKIVLNISPSAVQNLAMDNAQITFQARFGGKPFAVYVPCAAVEAIYGRENGQGMAFPPEVVDDLPDPEEPDPGDKPPEPPKGKPSLKIVK